MAMQGLGYMHSDLGGFAGANLDDELYTRWLQYGVFQPIYRPHAQEEVPAEPVFREPKTKALAKKSIELRYKLLPYNYTLAFQNNQTGAPLIRPLFFDEPNNRDLLTKVTSYLWGNDFLVTPILNSGVKEKEIYFPKNDIWFDFYTDEKFEGGQTKTVWVKENSIPTFVRAGAFIPMAKPMQSTNDYDSNNIQLHYYFDASVKESNSKMYSDDGETAKAFEKGDYELLFFESEIKKTCLELEFDAKIGSKFASQNKQIDLIIHNIVNEPKRIRIDGKKIIVSWNSQNKLLSIPINWNTNKELEINIKFNK